MGLERFNHLEARINGAIVVSMDTAKPRADLYDDGFILEQHGTWDPNCIDRDAQFVENGVVVYRKVDEVGTLADWGCIIYPELSPSTRGLLSDTLKAGAGSRQEIRERAVTITKNIPHMRISDAGLEIVMCGKRIRLNNGSYKESGERGNIYIEGNGFDPKKIPVMEIPITLENDQFFPQDVDSGERIVSGAIKLVTSDLKGVDYLVQHIREMVQNGRYSESSLRSLVDIYFKCDKSYSEPYQS